MRLPAAQPQAAQPQARHHGANPHCGKPRTGDPPRGEKPRRFKRGRAEGGVRGMDLFVSNYILRLDAKARVSIPAAFRAVLARDGFEGLYCYPALDQPAIDAGGNTLLKEIEALITGFPPYSEESE